MTAAPFPPVPAGSANPGSSGVPGDSQAHATAGTAAGVHTRSGELHHHRWPGCCPGLRRPPPLEPPYDDERNEAAWNVPGDPLPFDEESRPRRRNEASQVFSAAQDAVREPPQASELHRWAHQFLHAVLEVIIRRRPIEHLQPWVTEPAATGLRRAVWALASRDPGGRVATTAPGTPHTMHVVRLTRPAPDVAEVCAVIGRAERSRAVAVRLEHHDGRWQCVVFDLV